LLRSDSKREELKGKANTDFGYIQLSQQNETQALKYLSNNETIIKLKVANPQLYWTTL
jgi:hypothetical protein